MTSRRTGGRRLGSLLFIALSQTTSLALLVVGGLCSSALCLRITRAADCRRLGILSGLSYLTFAVALRLGPVSVVSPVVSAYGGFTVVAAVLLLGEYLSPVQAFGASVATIGILLVGVEFTTAIRSTRLVGPGSPLHWPLSSVRVLTVGLAAPNAIMGICRPRWPAGCEHCDRMAAVVAARVWVLVTRRRGDKACRPSLTSTGSHQTMHSARACRVARHCDCGLRSARLDQLHRWNPGGGHLAGRAGELLGPGIAVLVAVLFLGEKLGSLQWGGLLTLVVGMALVSQA